MISSKIETYLLFNVVSFSEPMGFMEPSFFIHLMNRPGQQYPTMKKSSCSLAISTIHCASLLLQQLIFQCFLNLTHLISLQYTCGHSVHRTSYGDTIDTGQASTANQETNQSATEEPSTASHKPDVHTRLLLIPPFLNVGGGGGRGDGGGWDKRETMIKKEDYSRGTRADSLINPLYLRIILASGRARIDMQLSR